MPDPLMRGSFSICFKRGRINTVDAETTGVAMEVPLMY